MVRLLLGALVVGIAAFGGGLVWENEAIEFKVKPGDTEAKVEFRFANKGRRPVRILRLRTTCGCTAAVADKQVYQRGETGSVTATFRFQGRTGVQLKTVRVTTDDPKKPTTTLQLSGTLPWNVRLNERLLIWKLGSAPIPLEVFVQTNPDQDLKLAKVDLDSRAFSCKLKSTKTPGRYRLVFTPRSTAEATQGVAALRTKPKLNNAEVARSRIFLYVK
ncbi:MAG: DUF1573 domain-containing protein [Victivallales bacterium]|nr:DUF1573 domain-containing protein [Victivallales bacterium]